MPASLKSSPGLESIAETVLRDLGLRAETPAADIRGGADAARLMNDVILQAIAATGVNSDGMLSPDDLRAISDHIRQNPALYDQFVAGHGDDEGHIETGFHLVQGDGGTLKFQGRAFVNTIADAIYHVGFEYRDGRFLNEDGNANEKVDDIAGWLNWYVNGVNIVFGTNEGETLYSGMYSAPLKDAASELFDGGGGNDSIWAGDGDDEVRAGSGDDQSGGGKGNDRMFGEDGNDKLWGDGGNDSLNGGQGHDTLGGGVGDDWLVGGVGNDTLGGGGGADHLLGGAGNDEIWAGAGADTAKGGAGIDTLGGGGGDDTLAGGGGNDEIWGESGDDDISGGAGNDQMGGGTGNDALSGGDGDDVIGGGTGDDTIFGGAGADEIWAGSGQDTVDGGKGNDTIGGAEGRDMIHGGGGNDTIWAGGGADVIKGGSGDDTLAGQDGADRILGGLGNDTLSGGNGRDRFVGGAGADRLLDWEDLNVRDYFLFSPGDTGTTDATRDVIEGFDSGMDKIDLSAFNGLVFQVQDAFSGAGRGEVRFDGDYVLIDGDGNGVAEAEIELKWVSTVVEADFIL